MDEATFIYFIFYIKQKISNFSLRAVEVLSLYGDRHSGDTQEAVLSRPHKHLQCEAVRGCFSAR